MLVGCGLTRYLCVVILSEELMSAFVLMCPSDLVRSCQGGPAYADINMFELVQDK